MGKKFYKGDQFFPAGEYDYIFPVEVVPESGILVDLPFNEGDNVYIGNLHYYKPKFMKF